MTSQYIASVPSDGSIPSEIVEYFSKFYEISDSPANHEKYADMFTADGTIIMASNRVQGREGKVFFSLFFFDSSSFSFFLIIIQQLSNSDMACGKKWQSDHMFRSSCLDWERGRSRKSCCMGQWIIR